MPFFSGVENGTRAFRVLQEGDRVVYGTLTGTQLTFHNRPSYRILAENEVLALLNGQETELEAVEA
jgi:hypothetical protein